MKEQLQQVNQWVREHKVIAAGLALGLLFFGFALAGSEEPKGYTSSTAIEVEGSGGEPSDEEIMEASDADIFAFAIEYTLDTDLQMSASDCDALEVVGVERAMEVMRDAYNEGNPEVPWVDDIARSLIEEHVEEQCG